MLSNRLGIIPTGYTRDPARGDPLPIPFATAVAAVRDRAAAMRSGRTKRPPVGYEPFLISHRGQSATNNTS